MTKPSKIRLDQLLVERGLTETRSQAKSLIMAGKVLINDLVVDKAGTCVAGDADIRIKEIQKYVSRGGLKLQKALDEFQIDVQNKICLDVGASTGGFTDCLIQHGAKKVYAVDVGYGQMHWKLQQDPRVIRFDRENFRSFDLNKIADPVDLVVMDVSFISIKLLLPKIMELFQRETSNTKKTLVTLIKPQFEVGPENVGKGGIVRDENLRKITLESLKNHLIELSFCPVLTTASPITGADGNVEYLACAEFSLKK